MKSYFKFVVLFSLASCQTEKSLFKNKQDSTIIYILPSNIEQLLTKEIKNPNTFFYLAQQSDTFTIYVADLAVLGTAVHWVKNTNRKLFINGKAFPLIFELDEVFATTDTFQKVLQKYKTERFPDIKKAALILEGYSIKFDRNGQLFVDK